MAGELDRGGRARRTVRPALAVGLHELRALVVNPSLAPTALMVVAFTGVFAGPFGFDRSFALSFMGLAGVGSVGGIGLTGILVEERARGVLGTLRRAGVPLGAVVAGKLAACALVAEALTVACALAAGLDAPGALAAAALVVPATAQVSLVSAAVGLREDDFQRASAPATAIVLLCMAAGAARTFVGSLWALPVGSAAELVDVVLFGGEPAAPLAATVAAAAAWSAAVAWWLAREVRRAGA